MSYVMIMLVIYEELYSK